MRTLRKKWISLILIFTILMAVFIPTIVHAEGDSNIHDVYIDNTVDNSKSYVTGKVVVTDSGTGEVTTEIVYEESIAVTYSNPKTSTVQGMIDEATSAVNTRASELSSDFYMSTDESTGKVWDNRKYTTVEDGDAVLIGDTDYLIGAYGVNDQYTRTHIASGDYGKNTYYVVTANVVLTDSEPTTRIKINTINATITAPEVGTKIVDENTKPNITLDNDANYSVSWTMFVNNYPSVDASYDSGAIFGTTVEDGKEYYLEVYLAPKEGYEFDASNNVTLKVNGGTDYELGYCSENQFSFFTKVKATKEETPTTPETPTVEATYEYIDNTANQKYTIDENDTLTFKINADYSLFENGGKVYVDDTLVSLDNYTSKSGSTIITFSKDYMSSLSEGEHALKVAFNNGGTATTKFTVAKASKTLDETKTETSSNNPKTGDNIATWISLMVVSMLGVVGIIKLHKKNK